MIAITIPEINPIHVDAIVNPNGILDALPNTVPKLDNNPAKGPKDIPAYIRSLYLLLIFLASWICIILYPLDFSPISLIVCSI